MMILPRKKSFSKYPSNEGTILLSTTIAHQKTDAPHNNQIRHSTPTCARRSLTCAPHYAHCRRWITTSTLNALKATAFVISLAQNICTPPFK